MTSLFLLLRRWRGLPTTWWLGTGALAVAATAYAGAQLLALHDASARLGDPVPVWVPTHDLVTGDRITSDDVRRVEWPRRLAPRSAAPAPVGRIAAAPAAADQPLSASQLAPVRSSALAARLHEGEVAITVAKGPNPTPFEADDPIDVYAAPRQGDGVVGAPVAIVRGARLVSSTDDGLTLALRSSAAPRLAYAISTANLTLVLAPTAPGDDAGSPSSDAAQ